MVTRWDELEAEYEYLNAEDTQIRFITDRTGLSANGVRRVLVQLNTPGTFGEEWDFEAQARDAEMSTEEYARAVNPLLQMSMELALARLHEVEAQIARGENPELSIDEREKVRKWETIVGKIISLSGQGLDVVMATLLAASMLKNRQREILQELTHLNALGEGPD